MNSTKEDSSRDNAQESSTSISILRFFLAQPLALGALFFSWLAILPASVPAGVPEWEDGVVRAFLAGTSMVMLIGAYKVWTMSGRWGRWSAIAFGFNAVAMLILRLAGSLEVVYP